MLRQFDAARLLGSVRMTLSATTDSKVIVVLAGGTWECQMPFKPVAGRPDTLDGEAVGQPGHTYNDWQLGWVGGGMSGLAMLFRR